MQNKLEILKTEERQLNDDLAVFEIKYIHSVEIGKLQEVRLIFKNENINIGIIYIICFIIIYYPIVTLILLIYDVSLVF